MCQGRAMLANVGSLGRGQWSSRVPVRLPKAELRGAAKALEVGACPPRNFRSKFSGHFGNWTTAFRRSKLPALPRL